MISVKYLTGLVVLVLLISANKIDSTSQGNEMFAKITGEKGISDALDVFTVDKSVKYNINGKEYFIGAALPALGGIRQRRDAPCFLSGTA